MFLVDRWKEVCFTPPAKTIIMEILIDDIPEEGMEIEASESDSWLSGVLNEVLSESFESGDRAKLAVSIRKFGGNVNIDGKISLTSHHDCDRCLAHFGEESQVAVRTVLSPLHEGRKRRDYEEEDAELVREDLDFGFYEGDRFDLDEIVREKLILAQPMKCLCRKDCRGLCQHCGNDLNAGPCSCAGKKHDPRWAALKNVKLTKS